MVDITNPNTYKNATTDTLVFTGPVILHSVTINKAGGAVVVYDGTSSGGTIVASITTTSMLPTTLTYDVFCKTGIYITIASTADVTVSYQKRNS